MRPIAKLRQRYEESSVYSFVRPVTGETMFTILLRVTVVTNLALEQVAKEVLLRSEEEEGAALSARAQSGRRTDKRHSSSCSHLDHDLERARAGAGLCCRC